MKTTIEIPEAMYRQAKARAAMEGLPLREFFIHGLRLALQTPPQTQPKGRAQFPLIRVAPDEPRLTDQQVYAAMNTDEDIA